MGIHGKGLNYLWDGAAVETWDSTGNNSAKVTLYDASGNALGVTVPLWTSPGVRTEDEATLQIRDTANHFLTLTAGVQASAKSVVLFMTQTIASDVAYTVAVYMGTTSNAAALLYTATAVFTVGLGARMVIGDVPEVAAPAGAQVITIPVAAMGNMPPSVGLLVNVTAGSSPSVGDLDVTWVMR